jgi:A/G-specific adenine glycosylase
LKALPGIGEYTAGAVASIAYGEVVPAVDGNVRRVLARLFDAPDPTPADLRALAGALVDPSRPGDFNQAFMELGAVTCKPRAPACPDCPLTDLCQARIQGTQMNRPIPKKGKQVPTREEMVVVATAGRGEDRRFLLRKRPPDGLLAGMWEFPSHEVPGGSSEEEVASGLCRKFGLSSPPLPFEPVSHVFSHLKVRHHPFLFLDQAREIIEASGQWLSLPEATRVPFPVAQGKILDAALNRLEILQEEKVRTDAGEGRS